MNVRNMESGNGNIVPNQFIINDGNFIYFQSYTSIIAKECIGTGKVFLDEKYWDYSVTTGKYRNQFLGETKKETQKKIDSGVYILCNFN